jgi:hypothetical protein
MIETAAPGTALESAAFPPGEHYELGSVECVAPTFCGSITPAPHPRFQPPELFL